MQTELLSEENIARAVEWLKKGEPVAFPTETVYGLGAPLYHLNAINKIFTIKGRPKDNPLIVHVSAISDVEKIAIEIPPSFYHLAGFFWPGPLTMVLKRHHEVPHLVSAGLSTIAVRMPRHPIALTLLHAAEQPLVAPSANLSGKPSATCAEHVMEDFQGKLVAILDGGATEVGLESTVIGLFNPDCPVLLRPGSITQAEIEGVLKQSLVLPEAGTPAVSPGMRYRHYAPSAPVLLFKEKDALFQHIQAQPSRSRILLARESLDGAFPLEAASLYHFLRRSDRIGCEEVLIFCDQKTQKDAALMNRLLKAAECLT